MKSKIAALSVLAAVAATGADNATANAWKSVSGEGLSGSYETTGHWNLGHVPTADEFADFRLTDTAIVTMPAGTYAAPTSFRAGIATGKTLTLDFSQTTWTDAGFLSGSVYSFWLDVDSSKRSFLFSSGTTRTGDILAKLSGATLTIERPTATTGSITFAGGTLNLRNPAGTDNTSGKLNLFYNQTGMEAVDIVFDGTTVDLPYLTAFNGSTGIGRLVLGRGSHTAGTIKFESASGLEGSNRLVLNAEATCAVDALNFTAGSDNRVDVGSDAVLRVTGGVTFSGGANLLSVGGDVSVDDRVYFSSKTAGSKFEIRAGGDMTSSKSVYFQANSADAVGLVEVSGGRLQVSGSSQYLYLNNSNTPGGLDFLLSSGEINITDSARLALYRGDVTMSVSGGALSATAILLGFNSGNPILHQTGGTIETGSIVLAQKNTGSGTLVLDGGVATIVDVSKGTGTGAAKFSANGGVLRASGANAKFIAGLDMAELGPKGLTLDVQTYSVTVPQAFQDAEGARGRLVKVGSGRLTLSGTGSVPSEIVAAEGTLEFAAGAATETSLVVTNGATAQVPDGAAFTSLMVRDGVLTLGRDRTATAGTVELEDVRLDLTGTYSVGDEVTLLTSSAEPSAATIRAWEFAKVSSGAPEGLACRFSVVDEDGVWNFRMTVAEAETVVVEQSTTGTKTDSSDRKMSAFDTLDARAASGGSLTLAGEHYFGTFVKDGAGTVKLTNAGNVFAAGVTVNEGTLYVSPLAALGLKGGESLLTLAGGTFEVNDTTASPAVGDFSVRAAAGSKKAYVVRTDTDVELNLPTATSGALIKRGAGTLCYRATGTDGKLTTDNGCQSSAKTETPTAEIAFNADGTPPDSGYAGLNVAEGTLSVKGAGPDLTTVKLENLVYVGLPVKGLAEQPVLSVENCTIATATSGQSIELGGGATAGASDVVAPTFAMTNAVLSTIPIFRVGSKSSVALKPTVDCCASRILALNLFMNSCSSADSLATFSLSGGSVLGANSLSVGAPVALVLDASRMAKVDGSPVQISLTDQKSRIDATFRNGSEFVGSGAHRNSVGHTATEANLRFDNGRWNPGAGERTIVQEVGQAVFSEGAGLVFAPAEGDAWTVEQPIVCEAPIVLTGAGAVSFAGEAATGLVLTGTGTVANATLTGATLKVSPDDPADLLTFADCTFAGRTTVDLGRTADSPIPEPFVEIPVARYSGATPAVGNWKLVGTGHEHVRGKFEAREGVVFVQPERTGLILYVR